MPHDEAQAGDSESPSALKRPEFEGFAPLQSNTTYCPNQFFDVVVPHFPRGVVRLVAYVIYRTFAWSDRDGRPMSEQHKISYRELIEKAGVIGPTQCALVAIFVGIARTLRGEI